MGTSQAAEAETGRTCCQIDRELEMARTLKLKTTSAPRYTINVGATIIRSSAEISRRKQAIERYRDRLGNAEISWLEQRRLLEWKRKRLHELDHRVETQYMESSIAELEKAYRYSQKKVALLQSALKAHKMNLKCARQALERELSDLLLEADLLETMEYVISEASSEENIIKSLENPKMQTDTKNVFEDNQPVTMDPSAMRKQQEAMWYDQAKNNLFSRQYDLAEVQQNRDEYAPPEPQLAEIGVPSRTEWDHQMLMELQEATRNLLDAEEEYSEAVQHAVLNSAIDSNSDRSSKFVDNPEDYVGLKEEHGAAIAQFDRQRIEASRERVPACVESISPEVTGDLAACDDSDSLVDFGESNSTFAGGRRELRIMRWNTDRASRWDHMYGRGLRRVKSMQRAG